MEYFYETMANNRLFLHHAGLDPGRVFMGSHVQIRLPFQLFTDA